MDLDEIEAQLERDDAIVKRITERTRRYPLRYSNINEGLIGAGTFGELRTIRVVPSSARSPLRRSVLRPRLSPLGYLFLAIVNGAGGLFLCHALGIL